MLWFSIVSPVAQYSCPLINYWESQHSPHKTNINLNGWSDQLKTKPKYYWVFILNDISIVSPAVQYNLVLENKCWDQFFSQHGVVYSCLHYLLSCQWFNTLAFSSTNVEVNFFYTVNYWDSIKNLNIIHIKTYKSQQLGKAGVNQVKILLSVDCQWHLNSFSSGTVYPWEQMLKLIFLSRRQVNKLRLTVAWLSRILSTTLHAFLPIHSATMRTISIL